MAQARGRVVAYVLFLKPAGQSSDWEKTDLWQTAASIPDVNVIPDHNGDEAHRFQATTSGQTALYDVTGHLLFSGGITVARGHAGDNAGRSSIVSLLREEAPEQTVTSVFGCPLYNADSECQEETHDRSKH
jgi:hypothetical protein